jgi:hypothetical protein
MISIDLKEKFEMILSIVGLLGACGLLAWTVF